MKRLLIILFFLPFIAQAQFPTKYKFLPTPVIDTPGDPESYRLPLPLKITGRDAGGAYYLKTIVL